MSNRGIICSWKSLLAGLTGLEAGDSSKASTRERTTAAAAASCPHCCCCFFSPLLLLLVVSVDSTRAFERCEPYTSSSSSTTIFINYVVIAEAACYNTCIYHFNNGQIAETSIADRDTSGLFILSLKYRTIYFTCHGFGCGDESCISYAARLSPQTGTHNNRPIVWLLHLVAAAIYSQDVDRFFTG